MKEIITDFYGLTSSSRCNKRRAHKILLNKEKTASYDIAVAQKKGFSLLMEGKMSERELKNEFVKTYNESPYISESTRRMHCNRAYRRILRLYNCEKRKMVFHLPSRNIKKDGLTVTGIIPTMYTTEGNVLEVIYLVTKQLGITQKGSKRDKAVSTSLQMYFLLLYARELYKDMKDEDAFKNVECVKASMMSLVRADDKFGMTEEFNDDFFDTGGRNYVSLMETIGEESITDNVYIPQIKEYISGDDNGKERGDCDGCIMKNLCNFKKNLQEKMDSVKMNEKKILLNLAEEQKKVIGHSKGIGRVIAGAGSGKTLVLTLNVIRLLLKGVKPEELLLVTYTKTAVHEMRERIGKFAKKFKLDVDLSKIMVTTFHGFGDKIIKDNRELLGYSTKSMPRIIDNIEKGKIILTLINSLYEEDGIILEGCNYWMPTISSRYVCGVVPIVSRIFDIIKKNEFSHGDESKIWEVLIEEDMQKYISKLALTDVIDLYEEYDDMLHKCNLLDYADQQRLVFEVYRKNPYYFEKFGFRHIVVDESQDNNENQFKILKMLINTKSYKSILFVGDDAQSIFGFQGAQVKCLIDLHQYLGVTQNDIKDYYLVNNYRSVGAVIKLANFINEKRLYKVEKDLVSTREYGKEPFVQGFMTKEEEYEFIVKKIKEKRDKGVDLSTICVIAMKRSELIEIATLLEKEGIPTVSMFPEFYLENSNVAGAMALFRFFEDSESNLNALEYLNCLEDGEILSKSDKEIEEMLDCLKEQIMTIKQMPSNEALGALLQMCKALDKEKEDELYQEFLKKLGLKKHLQSVMTYIEDFEIFGEREDFRKNINTYGVCLTTAHSSKGCEWDIVFNTLNRYDEKSIRTKDEMREERLRLLFVSVTRAKDELYLTGKYDAFKSQEDDGDNEYLKVCYEGMGKAWDKPIPIAKKEKGEEKRKSKSAKKAS